MTTLMMMRVASNEYRVKESQRRTQQFIAMLKERKVSCLEGWFTRAEQSGLAALKGFARGLRRDYVAVEASLSSPWRRAAGGGANYAAQAAQTSLVWQSQVRSAAPPGAACRLMRASLHHAQRASGLSASLSPLVFSTPSPKQKERGPRHAPKFLACQMEGAPRRALSSPLSSRARRSLPLQRQSTPRARRRPATGRLRRGSRCR
jgi:hypothetical protein